MKKSFRDIAAYEAWRSHCMTEALRYFFEYHDKHSLSDRDSDALAGVVYILEEISNRMRAVGQMLDVSNASDLDLEVQDPWAYIKGYPVHGFEDMFSLIKTIKNTEEG